MSSSDDNAELQADELTALASIYGKEMSEFNPMSGSFSIAISGSSADCTNKSVTLCVTMPPFYPTECPPVFELTAPWLRGEARRLLEDNLIDICRDFTGCPVVYAWAEAVKQFIDDDVELSLANEPHQDHAEDSSSTALALAAAATASEAASIAAKFVHGEPIEDRRSVFQAHLLAPIQSVAEARQSIASLVSSERKIASATHNIWAYRIARPTGAGVGASSASFLTDCDDDGECQAGGRLLRLLELSDARDVLIVVSRWYGGTLLGPDRFKHINNAARLLLEKQGVISAGQGKRVKTKD